MLLRNDPGPDLPCVRRRLRRQRADLRRLLDSSDNAAWIWGVTIAGFLLYAALLPLSRPPRLAEPSGRAQTGVQPAAH